MADAAQLAALVGGVHAHLAVLHRDHLLLPIEDELAVLWSNAFAREWTALRAGLARYRTLFPQISEAEGDDPGRVVAMLAALQNRRMDAVARAVYAKVVKAYLAGHSYASEQLLVQADFNVPQVRATAWLRSHAAEMVTKVDDTTRSRVAAIVTQGMEEGWSYGKVEADLKRLYSGFRVSVPQRHIMTRARLIAVNEAAVGFGQGQKELYTWLGATGMKIEKSWLSTGEPNTCEVCEGNSGEGWIPADQAFGSGDEVEPAHPACRCTTLLQVAPGQA